MYIIGGKPIKILILTQHSSLRSNPLLIASSAFGHARFLIKVRCLQNVLSNVPLSFDSTSRLCDLTLYDICLFEYASVGIDSLKVLLRRDYHSSIHGQVLLSLRVVKVIYNLRETAFICLDSHILHISCAKQSNRCYNRT